MMPSERGYVLQSERACVMVSFVPPESTAQCRTRISPSITCNPTGQACVLESICLFEILSQSCLYLVCMYNFWSIILC
jgi:hypothetical protein